MEEFHKKQAAQHKEELQHKKDLAHQRHDKKEGKPTAAGTAPGTGATEAAKKVTKVQDKKAAVAPTTTQAKKAPATQQKAPAPATTKPAQTGAGKKK